MNKLFLLIIFIVSLNKVFPQTTMIVKKSDGTYQKIAITDAVEIAFCPSEINYEEKTYHTVIIGGQCWFKENLDVGTRVDGSLDQTNNGTIEKYCYNNDPNNCNTYGGLYQWNEALQYTTTEGTRGICPDGWHIPTQNEFETLKAFVSNDGYTLKAIGQGEGTNTSGFSALLAGFRDNIGVFPPLLHLETYFWSSTEYYTSDAYTMSLDSGSGIFVHNNHRGEGVSIRCVKD